MQDCGGVGVIMGKMRGKSAGVTVRGLGKLRVAKMQVCTYGPDSVNCMTIRNSAERNDQV